MDTNTDCMPRHGESFNTFLRRVRPGLAAVVLDGEMLDPDSMFLMGGQHALAYDIWTDYQNSTSNNVAAFIRQNAALAPSFDAGLEQGRKEGFAAGYFAGSAAMAEQMIEDDLASITPERIRDAVNAERLAAEIAREQSIERENESA